MRLTCPSISFACSCASLPCATPSHWMRPYPSQRWRIANEPPMNQLGQTRREGLRQTLRSCRGSADEKIGPPITAALSSWRCIVGGRRCSNKSKAVIVMERCDGRHIQTDKPSVVLNRWSCPNSISVLRRGATPLAIVPLGCRR